MKTVIIIETAEELIEFVNKIRSKDDTAPMLPVGSTLVFESNNEFVRLEKAEGFELSNKLSQDVDSILVAMGEALGFLVTIT